VELNTKGRYAVMAMVDIAKNAVDDETVPLSTIADRQGISLAYLEQLFVKLRRVGLVESARGRAGGYKLGREASMISVADVMRAVEEDIHMTRCGIDGAKPCVGGQRCLTHDLWDALGEQIDQFLSQTTLRQIVDGTIERPRAAAALFSGGIVPLPLVPLPLAHGTLAHGTLAHGTLAHGTLAQGAIAHGPRVVGSKP
jgi:Rrf2 family transcriptional regulator, iron-sulfur cluster assembly transcription factor